MWGGRKASLVIPISFFHDKTFTALFLQLNVYLENNLVALHLRPGQSLVKLTPSRDKRIVMFVTKNKINVSDSCSLQAQKLLN